VVVSVISRLAFELAMWSNRAIPLLLVCEEAHRYIPNDSAKGFAGTRRAISKIAKEGRKYGVSLAIISQRPSELDISTLSQCSTIFSMRLSNERDQNFMRAAIPDGVGGLLKFLPSLGTAEAMVFGESVKIPMRILLNTLEEKRRPYSSSAPFTDLWSSGEVSSKFMEQVFHNWRARQLNAPAHKTSALNKGEDIPILKARPVAANPVAAHPAQAVKNTDPARANSIAEMKALLGSVMNK